MRTRIALLLMIALMPGVAMVATPADAQVVSINGVALDGNQRITDSTGVNRERFQIPRDPITGAQNAPSFLIIEGTFGIYTITRCPGCPGPARVVVDDRDTSDDVYILFLTDTQIQVRPTATLTQLQNQTPLTILMDAGFGIDVQTGAYPHGVVMDGTFACRGTARCVNPTGNRIAVSAFGGDGQVGPATDLIKPGGGTTKPSVQFAVSTARSFAREGIDDVACNAGSCNPVGKLEAQITFTAAGDKLNLPGSIAVIGTTERGDPGVLRVQQTIDAFLAPGTPTQGKDCGGTVPCECSDRVVASRVLVKGVDPVVTDICPAQGLTVAESNVVLDLNGNTIRGQGEWFGLAVDPGLTGVTVRGGRLMSFPTGVRVTDASATILSLAVFNADTGVEVGGGGNRVERVTVDTPAGVGIAVSGEGNTVTTNKIIRAETGVRVTGQSHFVERNVVERSLGVGVLVEGAGSLVERNQVSGSGGDGIAATGTGHTLSRNILKLNLGDGLQLPAQAGMTVTRNQTDRSGGFGILETPAAPGTANSYSLNICGGDALGDSSPAGLCL